MRSCRYIHISTEVDIGNGLRTAFSTDPWLIGAGISSLFPWMYNLATNKAIIANQVFLGWELLFIFQMQITEIEIEIESKPSSQTLVNLAYERDNIYFMVYMATLSN